MSDDLVRVDTRELTAGLEELEARANQVRRLLPVVGDILVTAVDDLIRSKGRGQWAKLKPATIKRRRGKGRGVEMLRDTGLLADVQSQIDGEGVEVKSPAPYSVFHTSDAPRTIIPQRDFFDVLQGDVLEEIADLVVEEVAGS